MELSEAKRILEVVYENKDKLNKDAVAKFTKAKGVFTSHYKNNPRAFIEDYIRILDGNTNLEVDFKLNPAQVSLVEALKDNRFVAAPKARQLGITTLTNALALHHSLFAMNANVICMAMKAENAAENLRRIKTMFKLMPKWTQWLVMEWKEEDGHQNNINLWSFKSKITGTGNKLEVSSASSADSTRGKTPTFLHWTETAFSDIAEEIFTSVFPALNRRKDSIIVLESTGNGNTGFYYDVCVGNRKGFEVVFMPWYLDRGYVEEGDAPLTRRERADIAELMGIEQIPEHLTDDQLRWYRTTSLTTGKAKGQQEYPINVEQVFQATNSSFFSSKCMMAVKSDKPKLFYTFKHGMLSAGDHGPCAVWETPKYESEYLISADTSEGVIDPTSINVFNPKGEEVAYWSEHVEPFTAAEILHTLAKHYNNAKIVIENNGVGLAVIETLQRQLFYRNLYRYQSKTGVTASAKTKPMMVTKLQQYILDGTLTFRNETLVGEMASFDAETLRASKGRHDDCVISSALAAFAWHDARPKYKMVQEMFSDYTNEVYGESSRKRRFI